MTGRKTEVIRFNLFDRGRKFTGQDRSNVDRQAWIDVLNSPATQEMITTGSALGYYGHQIRMLHGLNPPETVVLAGKYVLINPAVRTIELSCDQDGNVEHRQEFLQTPEGDHALAKYKAKIGGFSAAHDYKQVNGTVYPTQYAGMDYVLQPNYASNIGNGVLLDGMLNNEFVRQQLEISALEMYDSIFQTQFANQVADENMIRAVNAENALLEKYEKEEQRKRLILQKEQNLYDSALCPTLPLDEYLQQSKQFLSDQVIENIEEKDKKKFKVGIGLFGWITG